MKNPVPDVERIRYERRKALLKIFRNVGLIHRCSSFWILPERLAVRQTYGDLYNHWSVPSRCMAILQGSVGVRT